VQVGELLGEPHGHDLPVTATSADPPQAGQWRADQDLVNGGQASSCEADHTGDG
jgi:hypothetical protein